MSQELGFVGVGRMGGPMAVRLLDAGFPLTVYDTNADAVKALVDRGAKAAASAQGGAAAGGRGGRAARPAQAVAPAADCCLMGLPTPPIVQAVSVGEGGILRGTRLKTL